MVVFVAGPVGGRGGSAGKEAPLRKIPLPVLLYTLQFVILFLFTFMVRAMPLPVLLYTLQFVILLLFEVVKMIMPLPVLLTLQFVILLLFEVV
jgi:hypothetical protein